MPRPLRIEYPGAWYHVTNRGAGGDDVFITDEHFQIFLDLIGEVSDLFGMRCHAYSLMPGRYNLIINTPQANLSRCMRHLNGVYTQHLNAMQSRSGALFRGRYKAIVIDSDNYLIRIARYLEQQPVADGLVKRMRDYRWSSFQSYAGLINGPSWLNLDEINEIVGKRNFKKRYQALMEEEIDAEIAGFFNAGKQSPILGDPEFRTLVREYVKKGTQMPEIAEREALNYVPSIDEIKEVCSAYYGVSNQDLMRDGRGRESEARTVAMALSRLIGGYRLTDIGEAFGGISYMGVSSTVARVKKRRSDDRRFAQELVEIEDVLKID